MGSVTLYPYRSAIACNASTAVILIEEVIVSAYICGYTHEQRNTIVNIKISPLIPEPRTTPLMLLVTRLK